MLTVRVPESEVARAMGILNAHNVVDVHERAVQQGLTSATSSPKAAAAPQPQPKTEAAGVVGRDEVLRLAEEPVNVGKR